MTGAEKRAELEHLVGRLNAVSPGYTAEGLGGDLQLARDFVAEVEREAERHRRLGPRRAKREADNESYALMERLGISDTE